MAQTSGKKSSGLAVLFRILPVLGALLVLVGFGIAVKNAVFDPLTYGLIGGGMLLFLTLFIRAEIANLRYYLHVFIYSLLVLGICVVGYLFARQHTEKFDLTEQNFYSLSEQSEKVLENLEKPVTITVFTEVNDPFLQMRDMYQADRLEWEFIDARKNPTETLRYAQEHNLETAPRNGEIVISAGENTKRLTFTELSDNYENTLTNAIIEVSRDVRPKVYFLLGHGEILFDAQPAGPGGQTAPALSIYRRLLNQRGIETEQLDLARTGNVPQDAAIVVLAGPTSDVAATERAALEQYLSRGGKLLALLDVPQQNFTTKLTNIQALLEQYGVTAPDEVVIDLFSAQITGSPVQPLVAWFNQDHPVTRPLSTRQSRWMLSISRPLGQTEAPPQGLEVVPLIKSSSNSWSEVLARVVADSRVSPPPAEEMEAQTLGIAVSKPAPPTIPGMGTPQDDAAGGTRLVVFGTSELIQDQFLGYNQGAAELMLHTTNWLNEQEDMIAVPPRQLEGTPIVLDQGQLRLIFFFAVLLLPAALFFGGVSYSMNRRKR